MTKETRKAQEKTLLGKIVRICPEMIKGKVLKGNDKISEVYCTYIPDNSGENEIFTYILGVDDISGEQQCRIIGKICEKNSDGDKLVAAPVGMVFDQIMISEALSESGGDIELEFFYHKSCGAVIYRWNGTNEEYLILRGRRSNKWSFPKGHMEKGETEKDTAVREVFEEAGFVPLLDASFKEELHYKMPPAGEKTVVLFLAEHDGNVRVKADEIRAYAWADYEKAEKMLDHENFSRILKKAHEAIINKHSGN